MPAIAEHARSFIFIFLFYFLRKDLRIVDEIKMPQQMAARIPRHRRPNNYLYGNNTNVVYIKHNNICERGARVVFAAASARAR